MAKELNKQQRDYISYRLGGDEHITAVRKAYPTLTDESTYVIGCRLKKNPKVQEELRRGEDLLRERMVDKEAAFIDVLRELMPPSEAAARLCELIRSSDKRVVEAGLEKYLKLCSLYPSERLNVLVQADRERAEVLSEADIKKLTEKSEEKQREEVLKIEEGEVKEPAAEDKETNKEQQDGK